MSIATEETMLTDAANRIEQLEECVSDMANDYTPWISQGITELEYFKEAFLQSVADEGCLKIDIERLQTQVEELENTEFDVTVIQSGNEMQILVDDKEVPFERKFGHLVTDDQIDAAWALMEKYSGSGIPIRAQAIREALKKLSILECTCDKGIYTEGNDDGSVTCDRPCEVCGGHGWRSDDTLQPYDKQ
jgi:hypothetical protein